MKRFLITLLTIGLIFSFAYARIEQPAKLKTPVETQNRATSLTPKRNSPAYTFTKTPTAIIPNYYDYMIGSYNGLPLRVIPSHIEGGGYFMTYHGKNRSDSTRRMYYTYIDAGLNVVNNNTITNSQIHEGYGTIAVDPVSGKPFYAWHADTEPEDPVNPTYLEVPCVADPFYEGGYTGNFVDFGNIIDNPYSLGGYDDNEFIWPTAVIGPSPVDNMRRVYVVSRNSTHHNTNESPSENPLIAYADFNGDMIEGDQQLTWSYVDIPELSAWNIDQQQFRRPFYSIAVDQLGNLYYAGFHIAYDGYGTDAPEIEEPKTDVFKCDNYGQGTWTRVSTWTDFPMENPPETPGSDTPAFSNQEDVPYADGDFGFTVYEAASGHCNTIVDGLNRVQSMGIWSLMSFVDGIYWPDMQYVKAFIYDPTSNEFEVKEIYPQKDPNDNYNDCFVPWDYEEPWGEPEYNEYVHDDGTVEYYLRTVGHFPFPYWDVTAADNAMSFHYNNAKLTEDNECGMMAAVWQNSWRARRYNAINDPTYSDYQNTPEIWIAVSPDHGNTWSEPIVIDNQTTLPEFEGIKPMWVYPADKVIFTRMEGKQKVGRLGFLFHNDNVWGAAALNQQVDGGQVMFMELEIVFPEGGPTPAADDLTQTPAIKLLEQNYPNPFNPTTTISYTMNKAGNANLSVYNVKGQLVNTLVNGTKQAGSHSVVWDGTDSNGNTVPSGIYFYRLSSGNHVETKKMMLMK